MSASNIGSAAKPKAKLNYRPSLTLRQRGVQRLKHDRTTLTAIFTVLAFASLSVLAPSISHLLGVDPNTQNLRNNYAPLFSEGHVLGTDELGRDHLSRLLYGGQISLGIAFSAAFLTLGIGVAVGVYAGYYGGIVDDMIIWFITTLNSIPSLFLLILITSVLSPTPLTLGTDFRSIGLDGRYAPSARGDIFN